MPGAMGLRFPDEVKGLSPLRPAAVPGPAVRRTFRASRELGPRGDSDLTGRAAGK